MEQNKNMILTKDSAQQVVQTCLNPETGASIVHNYLNTLLKSLEETTLLFKSNIPTDTQMIQFQNCMDIAQRIADIFRKSASKNNALKYYYMGEYQAGVKQLQEMVTTYKRDVFRYSIPRRKNFSAIMNVLYEEKMIRQTDLARVLRMDRSNLSREMDILVSSGFVEQRKAGKFKYYNLSAHGLAYCEEHCHSLELQTSKPCEAYCVVQYNLSNSFSDEISSVKEEYTLAISYSILQPKDSAIVYSHRVIDTEDDGDRLFMKANDFLPFYHIYKQCKREIKNSVDVSYQSI